jgi:hypothetical protein
VAVIHVLDEGNVDSLPRGRGGAGLVLLERLGRHVWSSEQDSTRLQMGVCGAERCYKVRSALHVGDCIVHEYRIKGLAESVRTHIILDERALGIQFLCLCKHGGTQIDTSA